MEKKIGKGRGEKWGAKSSSRRRMNDFETFWNATTTAMKQKQTKQNKKKQNEQVNENTTERESKQENNLISTGWW